MSAEQNFEDKLNVREPRLSDGLRRHIRRLKEEGRLAEALRFKRDAVIQKRNAKQKLQDALDESFQKVILSDEPEERAAAEFEAVWIIAAQENLDQRQRVIELQQVYANNAQVEEYLAAKAPSIVHKVSLLVKEAEKA